MLPQRYLGKKPNTVLNELWTKHGYYEKGELLLDPIGEKNLAEFGKMYGMGDYLTKLSESIRARFMRGTDYEPISHNPKPKNPQSKENRNFNPLAKDACTFCGALIWPGNYERMGNVCAHCSASFQTAKYGNLPPPAKNYKDYLRLWKARRVKRSEEEIRERMRKDHEERGIKDL